MQELLRSNAHAGAVRTGAHAAGAEQLNIIQNTGTWLLEVITGQHTDDYNYMGGEDYSGMEYQGLGMSDELFSDGFYDDAGNFIPYDSMEPAG